MTYSSAPDGVRERPPAPSAAAPSGSRAVALRYEGSGAPRVTASGAGETAARIIEIAEHHGVPLHEDATLAELLAQVDLGAEIPRALFVAVAEVLAFAYAVSRCSETV